MKRDMGLVRRILMEVADSREPLSAELFTDDRHDFQEVAYHFKIMGEAGLLNATLLPGDDGFYAAMATSLTWEGQDFLSAVSNQGVWKKVSMAIAKRTGDATFDVVKALAVGELGKLFA